MRRRSEKELKKLVSKLATAPEEDILAVLAELDIAERHKVAALLRRHSPHLRAVVPPPALNDQWSAPQGLSPWLAKRLERESGDRGGSSSFSMTPMALDALQAAASSLPAMPSATRPYTRGRSLLGQIHGSLINRAAAL